MDEKLNSKTHLQKPFFGFFEPLRELLASKFAKGGNWTHFFLAHSNLIWVLKRRI
jgi:hypothetical protein